MTKEFNRRYIVCLAFMLLVFTSIVKGQAYNAGMKKYVTQFNTAKNKTEFLRIANGFESLAGTEKKEWLPFYYAGICNAIAAFESAKPDVDALCDKGDKLAKTADSLSPANSEIEVLRAMLAAARIPVNEKKRGQKYGIRATKYANSAIKLNGANPRAYLLKGRALLYTPEIFGGGAKKAKPVFETAIEKYKTFKPESDLLPVWGEDETEKELKKINNKPTN